MKIIFRILVILLAAALVAGALWVVVQNTSLASGLGDGRGDGNRPSLSTTTDGQFPQGRGRLEGEGGGEEVSFGFSRGLSEVLTTLLKVVVITLIVLAIQKIISLLRKRAAKPADG